jgi:hypothetical protein
VKRLSVDTASTAVKKFIRSLEIDANGIEVTLGGDVICKIIPPGQLTDKEMAAQLAEVRHLLAGARTNSKRLPAKLAESRIREALKSVRRGR